MGALQWGLKWTAMLVFCTAFLFVSNLNTMGNTAYASHKSGGDLGSVPPMGYSTWNAVRFNVSEGLIREVADSLVRTGLKDLGYEYINIDDGWQGGRDANGNFLENKTRFPSGMKSLTDYVHSKGLKIGIYTDLGRVGCGGKMGSYGYYQQDANQFAEWGFDYVKVDACGADAMGLDFKTYYEQFANALKNADPKRDILLNICEWGQQQPWKWAPDIGHTWRVGYDIDNQGDFWKGVLYEIDRTAPHWAAAGPGHFNDPDSLEVGVIADKPGQKSLTYDESVSNFSMWAVLASPLILGLDVTELDQPGSYSSRFADIVKNAEIIAVNQDPAGIQGRKVDESTPGLQIYSKALGSPTSGERAVVLFNRSDAPADMTVTADMIGLKTSFKVRDLWKKKDMGTHARSYSAAVPAHGSVMLRISGTYNPNPPVQHPPLVFEAEEGTRTGAANIRNVAEASGGKVVGNIGSGAAGALEFKDVTVPVKGMYQVHVAYVSGDANRNMELVVNGTPSPAVSFPSSGGWNSVRGKAVNVELLEGKNSIKLVNSLSGSYAPDIDKIEVSAVPVQTGAEDSPRLELAGPDSVAAGEPFTIGLSVRGVNRDIFAEDLTLTYDTELMEFVSVDSLSEGIRLVHSKADANGKVRLIMASEGAGHGFSGDGEFAEFRFKAKPVGASAIGSVKVEQALLGSGDGEEIMAEPAERTVVVDASEPGTSGDLNGDGKVSIGDLGIVAAHYGMNAASPDWNTAKRADINQDGKVDISDLAAVAQKILKD